MWTWQGRGTVCLPKGHITYYNIINLIQNNGPQSGEGGGSEMSIKLSTWFIDDPNLLRYIMILVDYTKVYCIQYDTRPKKYVSYTNHQAKTSPKDKVHKSRYPYKDH